MRGRPRRAKERDNNKQKNIKIISGFHKDKKDREKVRIGKIF